MVQMKFVIHKEIPCASNILVESWIDSLLSYFGLQEKGLHLGAEGGNISMGSPSSVLVSILSIVNLFAGDQGTLVTSHPPQNPYPL